MLCSQAGPEVAAQAAAPAPLPSGGPPPLPPTPGSPGGSPPAAAAADPAALQPLAAADAAATDAAAAAAVGPASGTFLPGTAGEGADAPGSPPLPQAAPAGYGTAAPPTSPARWGRLDDAPQRGPASPPSHVQVLSLPIVAPAGVSGPADGSTPAAGSAAA